MAVLEGGLLFRLGRREVLGVHIVGETRSEINMEGSREMGRRYCGE
jgi:hypothetical protein